MSTTKTDVINNLKSKDITLIDLDALQRVLEVEDRNTVQKLAQRLVDSGVLERIKRGQYLFLHANKQVTDFQIANFLLKPSYVSLESASAYHSLIDQFPYTITSVTTRKTKKLIARDKTFVYSSVGSELFWGYTKEDNFLIATPEKALIDIIYLSGKSDRKIPKNIHAEELNRKRLSQYLNRLESGRYTRKLYELGVELD